MANSSNTTLNSTNIIGLTTEEILFQLIYPYGIVGTVSVIFHALIAICVCRVEKLHNRFFAFILCLSLARVLFALSHVVLFVYRILRHVGMVSAYKSALECHSVHFLAYFAATWELLLLLLLVLDRVVSLAYPMVYKNLSTRQAIHICIGSYIFCVLVRLLPSYSGVTAARTVGCVNMYSPVTVGYRLYAKYLDFALSVGILLAYIILIGLVRYHTRRGTSNLAEAAVKKSMKVLPFLRLQLIIHCSFVLTSRSLQLAAGYIGEETATGQRLMAYYGEITSFDILVNAFVFYWKHPKSWYASVKMLLGERLARVFIKEQGSATTMIPATTTMTAITFSRKPALVTPMPT